MSNYKELLEKIEENGIENILYFDEPLEGKLSALGKSVSVNALAFIVKLKNNLRLSGYYTDSQKDMSCEISLIDDVNNDKHWSLDKEEAINFRKNVLGIEYDKD